MKKTRGFTLIELIVVLAIIGILAAWGVPSFREMMASSSLSTNVNNLVYAFQLARTEAITRSRPIDVVAAADGWKGGFNVKDGTEVIKIWEAMSGSSTLTVTDSNGITDFQFSAQGRLASTGTMQLCDSRLTNCLCLNYNMVGRVTVTTANAAVCP